MTTDSQPVLEKDQHEKSVEEVLLEACLASTGERLGSLTVNPDSTVKHLCIAASEAAAEAASRAGNPTAPQTRGTTGLRVIYGGRILEDTLRLSSTGLLQGADSRDGAKAAPVIEFLRCRPGHVATAGDGVAKIWSGESGECTMTLEVQESEEKQRTLPQAPMTNPDGSRCIRMTCTNVVKVYVVETGTCALTLQGHEGVCRDASYSVDGRLILTAADCGIACVWDAMTGRLKRKLEGHTAEVVSAQFSPDGTKVVTGSHDGTARIWNVATGKCCAKLVGHRWSVNCVAFSWDGVLVVSGSDDREARIWDVDSGECVRVLEGHRSPISEVCFLE